ncbi:MAG: hypothetical protein HOM58_07570 [Rhodospirillaceae bacterium]|nr:hypothetical protein [Rhodospirillaceae bacterium]MBT5459426.1 hypothetical protein [Rhodospirillaceae bacterium]
MSDDDIDLDRVISDPNYRRQVIEFLNGAEVADNSEKHSGSTSASANSVNSEFY